MPEGQKTGGPRTSRPCRSEKEEGGQDRGQARTMRGQVSQKSGVNNERGGHI